MSQGFKLSLMEAIFAFGFLHGLVGAIRGEHRVKGKTYRGKAAVRSGIFFMIFSGLFGLFFWYWNN